LIKLYASPSTLRQIFTDRLEAKAGEYFGLVHGNWNEYVGDDELVDGGTSGLLGATSLFRGIRRPRLDDGRDEQIYVYVLNPKWSYTYKRDESGLRRTEKPYNSVFVAYVELRNDGAALEEAEKLSQDVKSQIRGVVQFWEWVLAADDDKTLPDSFNARYDERMWVND